MNFGQAIELLKDRGYAQRAGWGECFILMMRQRYTSVTPFSPYYHGLRAIDLRSLQIDIGVHIDKHLGNGQWAPGWTPTQDDMFAEDWQQLPGSVRPAKVVDVDVGENIVWPDQPSQTGS